MVRTPTFSSDDAGSARIEVVVRKEIVPEAGADGEPGPLEADRVLSKESQTWPWSPKAGKYRRVEESDETGDATRCSDDRWCQVNPRLTFRNLDAIDGTGPEEAYAVGEGGAIIHWNGDRWQLQTAPSPVDLADVLARDDEVYASGETHDSLGAILRFDGERWQTDTDEVSPFVGDLWAAPSGELFAADGFDVWHRTGGGWHAEGVGGREMLGEVSGTDDGTVFAFGTEMAGTIWRYDGESWSQQASPAWSALSEAGVAATGSLPSEARE
ncbi:MAG: hypothetical protein ABEN55_02010 [Bradymonadaceae bacterium]